MAQARHGLQELGLVLAVLLVQVGHDDVHGALVELDVAHGHLFARPIDGSSALKQVAPSKPRLGSGAHERTDQVETGEYSDE